MIPAFVGQHLAVGRHIATYDEIERRFVTMFPTSQTRARLYHDWRTRLDLVQELIPVEFEWMDGSFVTTKEHPRDIDLATFVRIDHYEALSIADRQRFVQLVENPSSKLRFGCDSRVVFICPTAHPQYQVNTLYRGHWDTWWAHARDDTEKGYLEVRP